MFFFIKCLDCRRLLQDGSVCQKQVHQLVHKIINVSSSTLSARGLLHCGLVITLDIYQHPFPMCFDLTSTWQTAHDFLHPELTNCSVSLDTQVSNALIANMEIFVSGIHSSNVFIKNDAEFQRTSFQFRQSENG